MNTFHKPLLIAVTWWFLGTSILHFPCFALSQDKTENRAIQVSLTLKADKVAREKGPLPVTVKVLNNSPETIKIQYRTTPLQYIDFSIYDKNNLLVSEDTYGSIFSPVSSESLIYEFKSNHELVFPANPIILVPEKKRVPGKYMIRAVYRYKEFEGKSALIPFMIE